MTGVWASEAVAGGCRCGAGHSVRAVARPAHQLHRPAQHTLAIVRAHRRVVVADRRLAPAPDADRIGREPGLAAGFPFGRVVPSPRARRLAGARRPVARFVAAVMPPPRPDPIGWNAPNVATSPTSSLLRMFLALWSWFFRGGIQLNLYQLFSGRILSGSSPGIRGGIPRLPEQGSAG